MFPCERINLIIAESSAFDYSVCYQVWKNQVDA